MSKQLDLSSNRAILLLILVGIVVYTLYNDNSRNILIRKVETPKTVEIKRDSLPALPIIRTKPINEVQLKWINQMIEKNFVDKEWVDAQVNNMDLGQMSSLEADGLIRRIEAKIKNR